MEENKDDIIYELDPAVPVEEPGAQEQPQSGEVPADAAGEEIGRMVEEMGAETLLEIIRGNRNAAIRQIISEVEASQVRPLPSGNSASIGCTSIFDLAALA